MALSCAVDILSMTSVGSALICKLVSPLMASSGISATVAVVSAAILAVGMLLIWLESSAPRSNVTVVTVVLLELLLGSLNYAVGLVANRKFELK